jgi:hypothetical protein
VTRSGEGTPASAPDLSGAIDLHVHAAPDVRERKADMLTVARAAHEAGMRAVVFKSHHEPTASLAWLVNRAVGAEIAYGGVVLNRYVGGLNPEAVEAAAALGGRVVWMATFTARHHLRYHQEPEAGGITVLDEDGRLSRATYAVLEVVAARGLALATGHLAPQETRQLVPEARRRGVRAVVVTHPEAGFVGVPLELQRELAAIGGVYFDRCRNSSPGAAGLPGAADAVDRILENIRAVGVESTVLSTDYGQPVNPLPLDGLREYHGALLARGITPAELERMSRTNPAAVLGL